MIRKFITHNVITKNIPIAIIWLIITFITCISFADKIPLRVNLSSSMPHGIYMLTADNLIKSGDFVMVCLNDSLSHFALQRHYITSGNCENGAEPLLKQVVAARDDSVLLLDDSVTVNNIQLPHSNTLSVDKNGLALPVVPRGIYTLKENQLWLYGVGSARSWDSRYYGIINKSQVVSIVKPLLTWS